MTPERRLFLKRLTVHTPPPPPHDLQLAKLHGYGLSLETAAFLITYLKNRKENVNINNTSSMIKILLSLVL